jgi:hypothetical protein
MPAIPLLDLKLRIRQNYLNSLPPPPNALGIVTFTEDSLRTFGGDEIIRMRYIFEDNFETASPKEGWSYAGGNSNSTTDALIGSRSLRTVGNGTSNLNLGGTYDELWVFFTFYNTIDFAYSFAINGIIQFGPWGTGTTRFLGTGFDVFTGPNTTSVQKYCWMQYVKGTGSNAVVNIWLSDTPVRPVTASFSRTNLSYTIGASSVSVPPTGSGNRRQIDYLRISDKEIGDYPI